jgi:acetyl-CoA carboxylase carboxyl transferase subunit beta
MQMAKTVVAVNRLREAKAPFIAVLANPSTGQAYASFANLADIIIAEPGSVVGLSPISTMMEATGRQLPPDVHTAEYHLRRGLLDNVVDRDLLPQRIGQLLKILYEPTTLRLGRRAMSRLQVPVADDTDTWESLDAAVNDERPDSLYYMRHILGEFFELCGDRVSSDDRTVVGGIGMLREQPVVTIGQQRGHLHDSDGGRYHVHPDGLRKAQRLISLAARFGLPLISFIDSQGADPRLESEEQGIGNAIAGSLSMMLEANIPVISVIIGEAGNEAALALGVSDRILMQQYAIYSPISLNHSLGHDYHDYMLDREAAEALMLTAHDCLDLGVADEIVAEPEGGSHNDPRGAGAALQTAILKQINQLSKMSTGKLLKKRYQKFRRMGERSDYSQEAMTREVELLMSIKPGDAPLVRTHRQNRRRSQPEKEAAGQPEEPAEVPAASDD